MKEKRFKSILFVVALLWFGAGSYPALAVSVTGGTFTTGVGNSGLEGTVIAAPTASPLGGTYTSVQSVTLTATGAPSIRYTTDGTAPACPTTGTLYSVAISVGSSQTIKAISCYPNSNSSAVASFVYVINIPAPVVSGGGTTGGGGGFFSPTPPATPPSPTPPIGEVLSLATFNFASNLRLGMSGNAVTELQKQLTANGVYSGPITGYFGPLTLAGVKAYQSKVGVLATGFVGPLTRAQLNGSQVAGASTVNTAAIQAQIASLQSQLLVLLQQLAQMLQSQLR